MRAIGVVLLLAAAITVLWTVTVFSQEKPEEAKTVKLPEPKLKGKVSLEEAIKKRRCVRKYADKAIELSHLSQLLWAAGGITGERDWFRAAPSAGGLHPLDFYAVAGKGTVTGLEEGVWHYSPKKNALTLLKKGDQRKALQDGALGQGQIGSARVVVAVTVEYARTTRKYGDRGKRYALMDAGFAAENLFLQVQALDLAACVVGAFKDEKVSKVLGLPKEHEPLLLLTIGRPE